MDEEIEAETSKDHGVGDRGRAGTGQVQSDFHSLLFFYSRLP